MSYYWCAAAGLTRPLPCHSFPEHSVPRSQALLTLLLHTPMVVANACGRLKYPNETVDEKKARQRWATKKRVQKSRQRQKDMKVPQDVYTQNTLALLDAAKKASLQPRRIIGRLWAPEESDSLRKGVDKYGIGKSSSIACI